MIPGNSAPYGYTSCQICGSWVQYGITHMCGGSPQPMTPGTLSIPIPPRRAPFNPLNAEMLRLIIREELERHFSAESVANRAGKHDA